MGMDTHVWTNVRADVPVIIFDGLHAHECLTARHAPSERVVTYCNSCRARRAWNLDGTPCVPAEDGHTIRLSAYTDETAARARESRALAVQAAHMAIEAAHDRLVDLRTRIDAGEVPSQSATDLYEQIVHSVGNRP